MRMPPPVEAEPPVTVKPSMTVALVSWLPQRMTLPVVPGAAMVVAAAPCADRRVMALPSRSMVSV